MYTVVIASSGYMPDNEPQEYETLIDAKNAVIEEIADYTNYPDSEYKYQRWEALSRVTKRQIVHSKGLTVGVLYRPNASHDLGLAVTIHYSEEN